MTYGRQMLALKNAGRREKGLAEYVWNDMLHDVIFEHCTAIADKSRSFGFDGIQDR